MAVFEFSIDVMVFFPETIVFSVHVHMYISSIFFFTWLLSFCGLIFQERKRERQSIQSTDKDHKARESYESEKDDDEASAPNTKVQYLKDQLVQAKLFLSLSATRNNVHFIRQLHQRMKDIQRILSRANKDSELRRE